MSLEDKLKAMREYAISYKVPIVRDFTKDRLVEEVKQRKPKRILEIGTAIGYSTLLMKNVSIDSEIITIEKDEERYNIAKSNIAESNVNSIECILGDAFEVLDSLAARNIKFDFVFLDGPKGFYFRYLNKIIPMLEEGACIFADNVGFFGMVKSNIYPHRHKTIVVSLQNYLNTVQKEPFCSEIELDIDDGYAISTYKEKKE